MEQKLLTTLIHYFEKHTSVSAVYLFGSQARKDANTLSDVDIAVLFSDNTPEKFDLRLRFAQEIQTIFKKKVDICDIEHVELLFAYRILSEGKLVYSSNENKRIIFEVNLMKNYFDLKPFYDEYYTNIAKLAKGGKIDARPFTN